MKSRPKAKRKGSQHETRPTQQTSVPLRLKSRCVLLPDMVEEFFGHDVAHAPGYTAVTRVFAVILKIVAVVEGQLLARFDLAQSQNPDAVPVKFRFTIRRATVIDETRRIPGHVAVQVELVIQGEDVLVVLFAAPQRFGFGDLLAHVFDDARARWGICLRKRSGAMNG